MNIKLSRLCFHTANNYLKGPERYTLPVYPGTMFWTQSFTEWAVNIVWAWEKWEKWEKWFRWNLLSSMLMLHIFFHLKLWIVTSDDTLLTIGALFIYRQWHWITLQHMYTKSHHKNMHTDLIQFNFISIIK